MTLRELAVYLNLSPTTVSRALNGFPEVSEATRERVRRAATELNYRPSHNARQLATGRCWAIGQVIARSRLALFGPLFPDLMAGASVAAAACGYDLLMRVVEDDEEERLYRDLAAGRRVDGVIVHGPLVHDRRITLLADLALPFVVHGRSDVAQAYDWLDVDNEQAARLAVSHLLECGHTRIGLLNGPDDMHFARSRREGFMAQLHAAGIDAPPTRCFSGELTEDYGYSVTQALLRDGRAPSALFVAGLLPAFGALRALQAHGRSMPDDMAIVAFDDRVSWQTNVGQPPLFTTVGASISEAGARLVRLLVDRIEHRRSSPTGELMPLTFVQGRSTPTTSKD